ncbi:carbohydrate-binding protein [Spongiactinospora sp. TRM90649]|uniref:fibronectin type III domain-containing protein n=1 Tax=Spongiactinospora sp. TRM90649 TaxID=3031114 RepID=UPI0023F8F2F8|nr:carbohydrate-binding protein [Spongiactinospora sp. TRM90649]MDF5754241.1 fibronectin type III domain-containing protein [Spongiactinospora sp. TRM90649]
MKRILIAVLLVAGAMMPSASLNAAIADTASATQAAAWAPWTAYTAGARVTHNGQDYECIQAHTSLPGWEPNIVPALWKRATGGGDPTPPSTPGNLRSTGATTDSISLAWDASTDNVGVTGYNVYRAATLVTTVTGTTYTDGGLTASTSYTYTVRAKDAAGNLSTASSPLTASTTGGTGAPGQPGTVTTTSTNSSIALSWGASSGTVTGYRVYEGSTQKAEVTGTSATISGLGTCESHTYTVKAYNSVGESAGRDVSASTSGCTGPDKLPGAPYLYMGWGNPPNPGTVMDATGIKSFTMAFILAQGGCTPAWDGQRPLTGGADAQAINTIESKGGSVEISFGGWSGNKLGPACSTPQAYAGAVQQVINAVTPAVVDFDIENTDEFENYTVMDRILNGLKIVKQNNPNVKIVVTIPTFKSGLSAAGTRLVNQAKALNVPIDNYTIMPFNFSGTNMYTDTVSASEGLKTALKNAFGWSDAEAYAHMGISGMNGYSDQREQTTPQIWTQIRDWAKSKGLTRLAYWAVNRDRANGGGLPQAEWEFTRITAGF